MTDCNTDGAPRTESGCADAVAEIAKWNQRRIASNNYQTTWWEKAKDVIPTLPDTDKVLYATRGEYLSRSNGDILRCDRGFPGVERVGCMFAKAKLDKAHREQFLTNHQHDQLGYLQEVKRHLETTKCLAYNNRLSCLGESTWLAIGGPDDDSPICELELVSCFTPMLA